MRRLGLVLLTGLLTNGCGKDSSENKNCVHRSDSHGLVPGLLLADEPKPTGVWNTGDSGTTAGGVDSGKSGGGSSTTPGSSDHCETPLAEAADKAGDSSGGAMPTSKSAAEAPSASPTVTADAASGDMSTGGSTGGGQGQPSAGILTAGAFDDALNFDSFLKLFADAGSAFTVRVKDKDGKPVGNAKVDIASTAADATETAVLTTKTGTKGEALVVTGTDGAGATEHFKVTVTSGTEAPIVATFDRSASTWDVALPSAATAINALDLSLVVDATGSMGDELAYINAELDSIVGNVKTTFPNVDVRVSLIVYRDQNQGDEYVTRGIQFTDDLATFKTFLGQQSAGGGGDYPEAMDVALAEANQKLAWRGAGAARMMFLIADAPPHAERRSAALAEVQTLRKSGVAIYPVGASGVGPEAEQVMRQAALLTDGQYIFLTDDSGVGGSHEEPRVPCYHVELLKDQMIQAIAAELAGARQEPEAAKILRSVGTSDHGVCQQQGAQEAK